MKYALIQVYNPIDGTSYEKPYRVILDNAGSAVRAKSKQYAKQISMGIAIVEYDILSFEKRNAMNDDVLNAKRLQAKIEQQLQYN